MATSQGDITRLLADVRRGDKVAESRLADVVYSDLHRVAAAFVRRERAENSLTTTALLNEAYIRLLGQKDQDWKDRVHFFAAAAQAMRRILVDQARRRGAHKRGSGAAKVTFEEGVLPAVQNLDQILALEEVLQRLASQDPRQCEIVELRFYGGLTDEEVALKLGISSRTVKREWSFAKAWLGRELAPRKGPINKSRV
jgi:RNA polymerase sigma factor (TIGR02999 family)